MRFLALLQSILPLRSSKRLAEKSRALQSVSPGQFGSFRNADPRACDNVRLVRPGVQRDRGRVQRQAVTRIGDAERLRQLARSRAQRSLVMQSAAAPHDGNAVGRLQGADQHRAGGAVLLAYEVDAP